MESLFRLKPGVTSEAANGELRALTRRLGKENPSTNGEWNGRAVPLATEVVGFFRPALSVRMALGAQPRDVLWLVVRQGLCLAMIGGATRAAGALVVGRALSSLLYGVSSGDATAFAAAVAVALATALAACLLPARRAASLDPLTGLRAD